MSPARMAIRSTGALREGPPSVRAGCVSGGGHAEVLPSPVDEPIRPDMLDMRVILFAPTFQQPTALGSKRGG